MNVFKVNKTIEEINKKITSGEAVVVNAEEMIDIVNKEGVIEAAKKLTNFHFDVFTSFETGILPENVRIQKFTSNIAPYLNAADLVITQAGHSTAMELLALGKPSIVIPDFKQIEQENNALRMKELKTSVMLEYTDFSPEKLIEAIQKITNESIYNQNAQIFKELALEIQGSKKVAEVIKDYSKRLQYY